MYQEEEKFIKNGKFVLVKAIFLRNLNYRNDITISLGDAEETFLSLWIFINKKNPQVSTGFQEPIDFSFAETFYRDHIDGSEESREYLAKLLISYKNE